MMCGGVVQIASGSSEESIQAPETAVSHMMSCTSYITAVSH